jgi:hypothetical protein
MPSKIMKIATAGGSWSMLVVVVAGLIVDVGPY